MLYRIEEFRIDELRFDAVPAIKDASGTHLLEEIAKRARDAAHGRHLYLPPANWCGQIMGAYKYLSVVSNFKPAQQKVRVHRVARMEAFQQLLEMKHIAGRKPNQRLGLLLGKRLATLPAIAVRSWSGRFSKNPAPEFYTQII